MSLLIFSTVLITFVVSAYFYVKDSYSYWKRKGVPFIEPKFPFGNYKNFFLQKVSFGEILRELYNQSNESVLGFYSMLAPMLLIRDPKTIQDILIKEFSSFHDRSMYIDEKVDPMAANLLMQRGERWKHQRSKLTPAFTNLKLKEMFGTIIDCGKSLEKYFNQFAKSGDTLNVRDVLANFAITVIASVAFGIDVDCIENPESEFRKYGRKIFEPTFRKALRGFAFANPKLSKFFGTRFTDKDISDFMVETVRQNLEYREKNNIARKDFFQLLIQLRNSGSVHEDGNWSTKVSNRKSMSVEEMAGQAFIFFAGGFESTSTTMSFCMYELAKDQSVQQRVYEEIVSVLDQYSGNLSYDSVMEMKYLDHCVNETLRKYPPFASLSRECTKEYRIPDTDIVIDKGTRITIPSVALHYDPLYYNQPEEFIPERFAEAAAEGKTFVDMPFLSFGDGPRHCIGMRLAKLQAKLVVLLLIRKFRLDLGDEHKNKELKMDPRSRVVTAPLNGINLKVGLR